LQTDLNREHCLALNPQSHDTLHWAYTQMCKDKEFVNRFVELLNKMYEINGGKDVKDFK
jgi:selenophosphate synthetase-related protein